MEIEKTDSDANIFFATGTVKEILPIRTTLSGNQIRDVVVDIRDGFDARPNYVPFSFRLDKYQPPRGLKKGDVVNVKCRIYRSKTLDKPARAFHMTAARMTIVYQAGMFARGMEADE